jgi:hypothetical protein
MSRPAASRPLEIDPASTLEAEVDDAIALCGGDTRAALRATLLANAFLETQLELLSEVASAGFSRGKLQRRAKPTNGHRGSHKTAG